MGATPLTRPGRYPRRPSVRERIRPQTLLYLTAAGLLCLGVSLRFEAAIHHGQERPIGWIAILPLALFALYHLAERRAVRTEKTVHKVGAFVGGGMLIAFLLAGILGRVLGGGP